MRGILANDHKGALYVWEPAEATAGDDFNYVVSSLSATGRWVRQTQMVQIGVVADNAAAYNGATYKVGNEIRDKSSGGIVKVIPRVENAYQGSYATLAVLLAATSTQWANGDRVTVRGISNDGDIRDPLDLYWNASDTDTSSALSVNKWRPDDISGANAGRWNISLPNPRTKFSDSDATPDVSLGEYFQCADTAPAAITALDNLRENKRITIYPGAQNQTFAHSGGAFVMPYARDFILKTTDAPVEFEKINGVIYCLGSSGEAILTGSGSPVGSVTPEFAGQRYVDTTNDLVYIAADTSSSSWQFVGSSEVTVFTTVSALKASGADLPDQRSVTLLGYYTPGDGGGGSLVHLTTDGGVYGKLTISSGGSGYDEGIHLVPLTGGNSDATAWVYAENGIIVDGWVQDHGSGYTAAAAPDLSGLSGGSGFSGSFALGDDGEAFVQTAYASTARRFVRRQAQPFSARQFGAYGDTIQNGSTGALTNAAGGSVHDDADALQRLFNKGRTVELEEGTFAINSTLKYRFGTILRGRRAWTAVSPQRQITGNPRTTSPVTVVSQKLAYDRNRDSTIIWNGSASSWDVDAGTGTPIAMLRASSTAIGDDGAGWDSNVSADTRAMYGVGLVNVGLDCNNKADMGLCGWLCGWGSLWDNIQTWRAKWSGIFMTDLWSGTVRLCGAFYCEDNGMTFGQPYKSGAYEFFPNWGGVVNAIQFDNPRAAWDGLVGGTPGSVADGSGKSKQFTDASGFPNYHGHGLQFFLSRGNVIIDPQGEICDGAGALVEGPRNTDNAMANVLIGGYFENNGYHAVDEARAVFEYNLIGVCNNGFSGMVLTDVFIHPFGKIWIAGDTAGFNAGTGVTLLPNDYFTLRNCKTAGLNATGTGGVTAAGLRADHKYYKLIDCDIEFHNNIVGSTVGSNGTQPDPNGGIVFNGNLLCQNNMVLARGMVTLAAGSATVTEGHNLVYSAHPSTGQIDFTFSVPARSANYTVIANMEGLDGNSQPFKANVKEGTRTVSGFSIEVRTGEASSQALNNAGGKFLHLAVYGARDNSSLVKS